MPSRLTRPCVGLIPTTPQTAAGMRIEPPLSEPTERYTRPAATCAPDPPLDPPGENLVFQGFPILPKSRFTPDSPSANLFMFALPINTVPACFMRRATPASTD